MYYFIWENCNDRKLVRKRFIGVKESWSVEIGGPAKIAMLKERNDCFIWKNLLLSGPLQQCLELIGPIVKYEDMAEI
jgi:hypothetical protein